MGVVIAVSFAMLLSVIVEDRAYLQNIQETMRPTMRHIPQQRFQNNGHNVMSYHQTRGGADALEDASASAARRLPDYEVMPLTKNASTSTIPLLPRSDTILGFAIIGFPKCGTSTLHDLVDNHPQMASLPGENFLNSGNRTEILERELIKLRKKNSKRSFYEFNVTTSILPSQEASMLVGYKQSHDLYHVQVTGRNFATRYPTTPLVVTLRHPISWMESYWNFRYNNAGHKRIRSIRPNLILRRSGNLTHGIKIGSLQLHMGYFHHFLAQLGKTPLTDAREVQLLKKGLNNEAEFQAVLASFTSGERAAAPNRILVTSTEQMKHKSNSTFLVDLQHFLGLEEPFPGELPHVRPSSWLTDKQIAISAVYKDDICKPKYEGLRRALLQLGNVVADWLLEFFLKAPDVYTSGDLTAYLEKWKQDPCLRQAATNKTVSVA